MRAPRSAHRRAPLECSVWGLRGVLIGGLCWSAPYEGSAECSWTTKRQKEVVERFPKRFPNGDHLGVHFSIIFVQIRDHEGTHFCPRANIERFFGVSFADRKTQKNNILQNLSKLRKSGPMLLLYKDLYYFLHTFMRTRCPK